MKTMNVDVKLKSQTVEVIEVPVYETLDEVIDKLKEAEIVGLVNRQLKADMANATRGKYREAEPGKKKRYNTAFNVLASVTFDDGETGIQKLTKCAQLADENLRKKAMDELLESPEVQAEVDKRLKVTA